MFYVSMNSIKGHVKMQLKKLTLRVDPEEKQTYIRNVTTGSNASL